MFQRSLPAAIKEEETAPAMLGRVASKPARRTSKATRTAETVLINDDDRIMLDVGSENASSGNIDEGYATGEGQLTPQDGVSQQTDVTSSFSLTQHGSLENLVREPRELLKTINKIAQNRLENCELPLPKIVVVGDQSAGKSSLIEAISEITVPRASGVCTRCPLQINLLTDEIWSCTITVHKKYSYVEGYQPDSPDEYENWQIMDQPLDAASIKLHDKQDIEMTLRKAQEAVLRPRQNANDVLRGATPSAECLAFSPNIIRLDICGQNLPTLTMYDLPGIINQSEDGEEHLPKLVRDLAIEYMRPVDTIVMLACPMTVDPATSSAADLVKRCNAQRRCIGVLTKPDAMLEAETLDQWIEILKGEKFKLGYGYYATKQPSPGELKRGIDHRTARAIESDFFANRSPWTDQLLQFRPRCGTSLLQSKLSSILVEETKQALPIIESEINRRLNEVTAGLLDYPKPPENCLSKVFALVEKFRHNVDKMMVGEFPDNRLRTEWRELSENYRQWMVDMKPVVVVSQTPEKAWNMVPVPEPISLDSDDETDVRATPGSKRQAPAAPHTPNKRHKPAGNRSTPFSARRNELAKKFKLDEIRVTIRDMSAFSSIPSETDPRAEERLYRESVENWDQLLDKYIERARELLGDRIRELVHDLLKGWHDTVLYKTIQNYVHNKLADLMDQYKKGCDRYLHAEQQRPCILNNTMLKMYQKEEEAALLPHRRNARARHYLDLKEGTQWKNAQSPDRERKATEREKKVAAVKDQDLGEDPFQPEMNVMSRIRGLYMLVMGRLVDTVCTTMDFDVFERCRKELAEELKQTLGLEKDNATSRCQALLADDNDRERKRASLEAEKQTLLSAKQSLDDLFVA